MCETTEPTSEFAPKIYTLQKHASTVITNIKTHIPRHYFLTLEITTIKMIST